MRSIRPRLTLCDVDSLLKLKDNRLAICSLSVGLRRKQTSRMVLQVHDEFVFHCPENEVETVSALLVDTSVGMNWLEAH